MEPLLELQNMRTESKVIPIYKGSQTFKTNDMKFDLFYH